MLFRSSLNFGNMEADQFLYLTDIGHELSEQIYERHCFFRERLIAAGIDPQIAEIEACRMEHTVSQESFERIRDTYENRKSCDK